MPTDFTMPKLGLTMEEGTVVEWLVPDGADVDDGTAVVVVQTDKVETEVSVLGAGRLHQLAGPGTTLACGEVVGVLLAPGEDSSTAGASGVTGAETNPAAGASATTATATATATTETTTDHAGPDGARSGAPGAHRAADGRLLASPNARRVANAHGIDLSGVRGTGPGGRIVSEDVEDALAAAPAASAASPAAASSGAASHSSSPAPGSERGTFVPATFAARNLADLLGVDITTVAPDAAGGLVDRDDVARHVRALLTSPTTAPNATETTAAPAPPPPATQTPSSVVAIRGIRGTIAKRMHASLREMAQLTLTMDADLDAVVDDRRARQAHGSAPGYTDYVIAAVARALREHPHVNSQVTPDGIALLPEIHVGLAVALDEGLVVPVVRHADRLGLGDLAAVTARLADSARSGSLTLDELEGGTFSVSALGMFGVDAFTPVINPPNTAILGVGRLRRDLVLVDAAPTEVTRITLSLTWDHRVFDGAPAAAFAQSIVAHLAEPAKLDETATADHRA